MKVMATQCRVVHLPGGGSPLHLEALEAEVADPKIGLGFFAATGSP